MFNSVTCLHDRAIKLQVALAEAAAALLLLRQVHRVSFEFCSSSVCVRCSWRVGFDVLESLTADPAVVGPLVCTPSLLPQLKKYVESFTCCRSKSPAGRSRGSPQRRVRGERAAKRGTSQGEFTANDFAAKYETLTEPQ